MTLCHYRDALGRPRQGIHAPRMGSMARNDWLLTIAAALVITALVSRSRSMTRGSEQLFLFVVILTVLEGLAIVAHRLFCVRTTVDRWLFSD